MSSIAFTSTMAVADVPIPLRSNAAKPMTTQPKAEATPENQDFTPDPKKRLTLEQFIKGAKRLDEYLIHAVEKASDEDKKFLSKEKAEIERQLQHPEQSLKEQFDSIDAQIARLKKQKLFSAPEIAQMRMHYLETEAGKVLGVLQKVGKKPGVSDQVLGEIEYQLGIIAQRDQVNFKTTLRRYKNAVKFSPTNIEYLSALADLYVTLQDDSEAAETYKKILVQMKKQSASVMDMAKVQKKLDGVIAKIH